MAPLGLPAYELYVREASERTGLGALGISPHSFRHSSASFALLNGWLDLKGLMERMRVHQISTVRRYAQRGAVQRQAKLMGRPLRLRGERFILATQALQNPVIDVLERVYTMRTKRLHLRV